MAIRGPGKSARVSTPLDSVTATLSCSLRVKKWFTTVETVKKMYAAITSPLLIENEEEIMVGYFENDLEYGNILENSERVKVKRRALAPDVVTFTDDSWHNLANNDIMKGSVVVTDTSESVEWTEGVDYEIDYTSGKIRRVVHGGAGGAAEGAGAGSGSAIDVLPVSVTVENSATVHYEYFSPKVKDFDYSVNYERGTISRKLGGSLVSGSKVYVDYKVQELVQDEVVALSIDQAHVWIISRIGDTYETKPDENLRYGEAYHALYLIAKMSAANLIYEKRNDDVESAAEELKLIADDFRSIAMSFLHDYIRFPIMSRGGRIVRNRSMSFD